MPYKGKAKKNATKAMKKKGTLSGLRVNPDKVMKPKNRKGKSKK